MKYNILGFYQPRAIELGLDSNDLLVLRWFVDYAGTSKMRTMIIDNKMYYWINYASVLEELPILKVSKQTLAKKHFGNLVNANVLEHKHIKEGGSFSYYCYGINYDTLIYLQTEGGCVKNTEGASKITEGCVNSDIGGASKNTDQINNILNNNNSIIYNKKEKNKKEKTISEMIEEQSDELKPVLEAFVEMRRKKEKGGITDYAFRLMLGRLEKMSGGNIQTKIQILNQSIINNWKDVYELKEGYNNIKEKADYGEIVL